jgi:hypothetical protein
LALGVAAVLLAGPGQKADPEVQLEAALHREIVLGAVKGALEQYKAILAQPGNSKETAARALWQMHRWPTRAWSRSMAIRRRLPDRPARNWPDGRSRWRVRGT